MQRSHRNEQPFVGIPSLFLLAILAASLLALSSCDPPLGSGSTSTTTLTTTTTTLPTEATYSMTFAGTGLADTLTVTAKAFDKVTRGKVGDDFLLTWNSSSSRYEGDITLPYDYGEVILLVFGTDATGAHAARAIEEYDVATGGSAIPFTAATKYELLDIGPGGGYISIDNGFYESGGTGPSWRYVEMAPVESATTLRWSNTWIVVTNTSDEAIGTGKSNTAIIVGGRSSTIVPAAWYCDTLDYNGCTDWFLPSYGELKAARDVLGSTRFLHDNSYWSSSERTVADGGTNAAYYVHPYGANEQGPTLKSSTDLFVKAARSF
jgi:hypothetical protein